MTFDIGAAVFTIVGYIVFRIVLSWFAERESATYSTALRVTAFGLKLIGGAFVLWGLYLIYIGFRQDDRLSMVFTTGYGISQVGLATIIYRLPALLRRETWSSPWNISG